MSIFRRIAGYFTRLLARMAGGGHPPAPAPVAAPLGPPRPAPAPVAAPRGRMGAIWTAPRSGPWGMDGWIPDVILRLQSGR